MSAGDDDKRDRLAADRLKALGRHDLVSADGKLWWNGSKWEPIGLSLNYEVSSAEEMSPRQYRHGIEGFPFLNLPSKDEVQNAKQPDPEEAKRWANEIGQAAEKAAQRSRKLAQKPAPTLQEAERLIEAEPQQRTAQKSEPSLGTISEDGTQEWDGEAWQRHLSYDGTKSFNGKEFVPLSYPLTKDEERRVGARLSATRSMLALAGEKRSP